MKRHHTLGIFTVNWINISVIIATTVVLLCIIIASLTLFVRSQNNEEQFWQHRYEAGIVNDILATVKVNETSGGVDSVYVTKKQLSDLENRLKSVEKAQENVLADLRQESNNIINKANGWLGFWIAVLTIFCGIIPIVIQYVLNRKAKNEFDKMISDLDNKAHSHHLFNIITSLHINKECSIIRDSTLQKDFISSIVCDAYQTICHLIEKTDTIDEDIDRKGELILLGAMVQYCRLIELLKALSDDRHIRELDKIEDKLKQLIKDLLDHERVPRHNIRARLIDLLPQLSALHTSI